MKTAITMLMCVSPCVFAGPAEDLAKAEQAYDLDGARELVTALEKAPGPDTNALRARAHLLVAELLRIEFEFLPEDQTRERRALGADIDLAADAGLDAVALLPETSEKYRLKADLLGTKIRSNYRAGKYKDEINRAIEEALARDPKNARAYLSRARTLIFRPSPNTSELRRGLDISGTAMALDGGLERARLLQAYANEQLEDRETALLLYRQCLQENPSCLPAARALERLAHK